MESTANAQEQGSSESLLSGLRGGSDDAWHRLVDLYAPLARSWCLQCQVPEHRIPDVLQDVFLAIHRSIDRFEYRHETAGFRGWVWMITKNKIRDHFRAASAETDGRGGSTAMRYLAEVADPLLPDEAPSEASETAALLHRAMAMVRVEFRSTTWDAFWRATVLGQPTAQIAEELGISAASVRQAKSRVLRRLRQQLGELG